MGVYVFDMEMPASCDDCRLNNGISCYAVPEYTEDGVVGRTNDRPDWCPLVYVPPHGRLIDADTLEHDFRENAEDAWNKEASPISWADAFDDLADMVADAPTIVPADSEKEEDHVNPG